MRRKFHRLNKTGIAVGVAVFTILIFAGLYSGGLFPEIYGRVEANIITYTAPKIDIVDYERRLFKLAGSTNSPQASSTEKSLWPAKIVYPKARAILPFKRVVAYYGNFYSKRMGILGEYPPAEVLRRLAEEVEKWELADPETPVQPALHYIAITAQKNAGVDGKYRLRMPTREIDKALTMSKEAKAIVFLDVQIGLSDLRVELPLLENYFKQPKVHLGIDPEFSMKNGDQPGTVIGTIDATDINYAANYLAKLVRENNLPPKILVIHRFTQAMMTNYQLIKPLPEVQIVIDMDGWGAPARKINTYESFIASEPVQFTGFKLFYKNDLKQEPSRLMTPTELLKLKPRPIYIQYQ